MVRVLRGSSTIGRKVGGGRVRFDAAARPAVRRPGNLLVAGATGTGKSYTLKQLTARTVRRGGRVLVVSHTGHPVDGVWRPEYAPLADVVPDSQVVTFGTEATHTLDPTRTFSSSDGGARHLATALQILGDVLPDSVEGRRIHDLCRASTHGRDSIERVLGALAEAASDGPSRIAKLYRKLAVLPGVTAADAIFNNGLPQLLLYGRFVVFDISPFWNAYNHREAAQLGITSIRDAHLYLVIATALEFCRRGGFATLILDDAADLAVNHPDAWQLVIDHARHGCYDNSAVWIATQTDRVLGFDRPFVDAYFPHRLLFRPHSSASDGRRNPAYDALPDIDLAKQLASHEGVWVDDRRGLHHLRVAPPSSTLR